MRVAALLLLLANLLFFAWSHGWLDGVAGARASGDREPERLALQVRPEAVRVLTPPQAALAAASAAAAAAAAASAAASSLAAPASGAASASASGSAPASAPAAAPVSAPTLAPAPASAASAVRPAPAAASAAGAAASAAAAACFEAGPFAAAELAAAQAALKAALPPGTRWADVVVPRGGAWVVYMGTFANREAQQAKEDQLRRIRVDFEEMDAPAALGPGLSLGRHDSRAAADAALAQLTRRGIRTARVVELSPPVVTHLLRIDRPTPLLAAQLAALNLPALRGAMQPCRRG